MTFASVNDMRVILEFVFDGFVVIGGVMLAIVGVIVFTAITLVLRGKE